MKLKYINPLFWILAIVIVPLMLILYMISDAIETLMDIWDKLL